MVDPTSSNDCAISDDGDERETELLPLEGCSSKIWKYFGFPAKDGQYIERDKRKRNEVTCGRCKKRFKYNGNTSNMRSHLSALHPSDFAAMEREEKEDTSDASRNRPRVQTSIKSKSIPVENQLPALFEARQPLPKGHPRWKKLTDSLFAIL